MNPDSGKLHGVAEGMKALFGRVNPREGETVEQVLERARARHAGLADGEPEPGSPLPAGWPVLVAGQELKQVKGWKAVIDSVDLEAQTVTVKMVRR